MRRQHCTSQRRNHLQTAEAPVLAAEEDLLWGWTENKEQLCKLYGATLWEMPFPFPTGKCAERCFQRPTELHLTNQVQTLPGMARWAEPACLWCPGPGWQPGPAVGSGGKKASFLDLYVLICLLASGGPAAPLQMYLPHHQHSKC